MYDTNNLLSFDTLLQNVEPYQIFSYYLGKDIRLSKAMQSPLRKDSNPSFALHISKTGYLYYNDWSTGDWGGPVQFVKKLFNLPDLYSAASKINYDMGLGLYDDRMRGDSPEKYHGFKTQFSQSEIELIAKESSIDIKIKQREWSEEDLEYWAQFGITKEILVYYNVFPCEKVYVNKTIIYVENKRVFKPAYAYVYFKDGEYSYKIYQPLTPESKWISNVDLSVLQGWDQMPKTGKTLIITKSQKDVMTLFSLGISAVASQGELIGVKPHIYQDLKERFKFIYFLNDFDKAGVIGTKKQKKLVPEIKYFFLQTFDTKKNGFKDVSDHRKGHTALQTVEHLRNCLTRWNPQQ